MTRDAFVEMVADRGCENYWQTDCESARRPRGGATTEERWCDPCEAAAITPEAPFRRHSDPHGCPVREQNACLGIVCYCKLPEGHEGGHAMESATPYHLAVWERA